jgi:hypothetical protein
MSTTQKLSGENFSEIAVSTMIVWIIQHGNNQYKNGGTDKFYVNQTTTIITNDRFMEK